MRRSVWIERVLVNNAEKRSETDDVTVYSPAMTANHHSELTHIPHISWRFFNFAFQTGRTKLLFF